MKTLPLAARLLLLCLIPLALARVGACADDQPHDDDKLRIILLQDASFMVTVPFFCPDVPALVKNPVFLYSSDDFKKPYPFQADIAVSIDDAFETKGKAITVATFVRQSPLSGQIRMTFIQPGDIDETKLVDACSGHRGCLITESRPCRR